MVVYGPRSIGLGDDDVAGVQPPLTHRAPAKITRADEPTRSGSLNILSAFPPFARGFMGAGKGAPRGMGARRTEGACGRGRQFGGKGLLAGGGTEGEGRPRGAAAGPTCMGGAIMTPSCCTFFAGFLRRTRPS